MNLLTLTDTRLASLYRQMAHEIARRAKAATDGHDAASLIHGNEMAKRALVVAAAGNHSILFLGPPNSGKTMLRAVALDLGLGCTFEALPCPCGYRNDPRRACGCSGRQIERHIRKLPVADISIEVVIPPEREMRTAGTTLAEMCGQIKAKSDYQLTRWSGETMLSCRCEIVKEFWSGCMALLFRLPRGRFVVGYALAEGLFRGELIDSCTDEEARCRAWAISDYFAELDLEDEQAEVEAA